MSRISRTLARAMVTLVVFGAVLGLRTTAHAQLVGLDHVWTIPGAMNTVSGHVTVIACTNSGTASATVGVELYGAAGTLEDDDSLTLAPHATVIFATNSVPGLAIDVNMSSAEVGKGYARVLASTKKGILCSAYLAESGGGYPTVSLTVANAFKQKGD